LVPDVAGTIAADRKLDRAVEPAPQTSSTRSSAYERREEMMNDYGPWDD
jgi:hypothetical protein